MADMASAEYASMISLVDMALPGLMADNNAPICILRIS